ncbi:GerMN domain-containing protein [Micromonospora sp. PLK6-60]|uniref:Gmad2 immunoglobulin-like domain-containing protein n=1 Tax=Micromonospora sp. PLK6-60 TaxID=2873383 RepID=UPI001CA734A0|nr:Gmad2 immunoglobulin-like domain-containing protein [Micromonospora sp. PLK6-60]MBY8874197.1 GerMN domain-containing protein [Micromonospora sp. PLK6-60]
MRRVLAPLLAAALLAAGCADARSGTLGPAPTLPAPVTATAPTSPAARPTASAPAPPSPASPPPASPPPASPAATAAAEPTPTGVVTVHLWFVRDGRLVPTARTRPATPATSRLALTELAAGPSPAEAATGMTTLLPAGVQIVRIAAGTATVAVPTGFDQGAAATVRLRRAQLVWTLTQFPTVRRVDLGDGAPTTRADYAALLPPIVVTAPLVGQPVTTPVTVTGTAQVFEATVSIRILDRAGREIGTGFTTATCGTGCRGDYRTTVRYRLAVAGPGTIEVYEVSARDGSRVNVVAVPVALAASAGDPAVSATGR